MWLFEKNVKFTLNLLKDSIPVKSKFNALNHQLCYNN